MAKVPNGVETMPKIYFNRLSRVHERYRRQTDDRWTDDDISEREREFAKN